MTELEFLKKELRLVDDLLNHDKQSKPVQLGNVAYIEGRRFEVINIIRNLYPKFNWKKFLSSK